MSVVVRMEMPKDCWDCPCANGEYGYCQADKEEREIEGSSERPSWCPIIFSLPDGHGDLINREYAIGTACSGITRTEDGEKWIRVHDVRESIKSAPAIVPAEAERSEV